MKQRLSQQSTWLGVGAIAFALYRAIASHDFSYLPEAMTTGFGLIAVNA